MAIPVSSGDCVHALFYGEWHPGVAHGVTTTHVTVRWSAEETQSILPTWAVVPLGQTVVDPRSARNAPGRNRLGRGLGGEGDVPIDEEWHGTTPRPHAVCAVGDRVLALFYGEWHPAIVRAILLVEVEVLWEKEETCSILFASHVMRVVRWQQAGG